MVVYGCLWLSMVVYGCLWLFWWNVSPNKKSCHATLAWLLCDSIRWLCLLVCDCHCLKAHYSCGLVFACLLCTDGSPVEGT